MDTCPLAELGKSAPVQGLRTVLRWLNSSRALPWLAFPAILWVAWRFLAHHVFWRDEAHALLIVQNCPDLRDFLRAMSYEGTPFLWHLGLWLIAKLIPLTPERLQLLHFVAVVLFVGLALGLPRVSNAVRLMMVFQMPMVEYFTFSRQYLWVIVGLYAFAHVYLRARRSAWLFVILFLISQVSAHGGLLALGLLAFLIGEDWFAGARKVRLAWLLPLAGAALCAWQMRMPPDIIEGHRVWRPFFTERTAAFFGMFVRDVILKDTAAGAFFAAFVLLAFYAAMKRETRRAGWVAFLVGGWTVGFFLVGAVKYSCPRHHWLLTYAIFIFAVILFDGAGRGPWTRWAQTCALGALIFGGDRFLKEFRFQAEMPTSHSAHAAAWLDRRYPGRDALVALENFIEPIMVYRQAPGRIFALGRQQFIRYVIWNHPSIDFSQGDDLRMSMQLSDLLEDLRRVPKSVLATRPVVIFSVDNLRKPREASVSQIPVGDGVSLRLVEVFSGASFENYLVYEIDAQP